MERESKSIEDFEASGFDSVARYGIHRLQMVRVDAKAPLATGRGGSPRDAVLYLAEPTLSKDL